MSKYQISFSAALDKLKAGEKVAREGWNGKHMWLELQKPDENSKMTLPYIYIEYPKNHPAYPEGSRVPWLASQTDLLSEDWVVVEPTPSSKNPSVKKYRERTVTIEAMILSEKTLESLWQFVGEEKNYPECKVCGIDPKDGKFKVRSVTDEHDLTIIAEMGDFIIKEEDGSFSVSGPDIFKKTYGEVK